MSARSGNEDRIDERGERELAGAGELHERVLHAAERARRRILHGRGRVARLPGDLGQAPDHPVPPAFGGAEVRRAGLGQHAAVDLLDLVAESLVTGGLFVEPFERRLPPVVGLGLEAVVDRQERELAFAQVVQHLGVMRRRGGGSRSRDGAVAGGGCCRRRLRGRGQSRPIAFGGARRDIVDGGRGDIAGLPPQQRHPFAEPVAAEILVERLLDPAAGVGKACLERF